MKLSHLALAVAGVLVSAQAFAVQTTPVTKAQLEAPALPVQQTWITGASASVFAAFDSFGAGCNPGTLAVFTDGVNGNKPGSYTNATGGGTNFTAYACTRGTGTSEKIAVMYQSAAGGSLLAVTPHTLGINTANGFVNRLKNLTLATSTCTGTSTSFLNGNPAVSVPVTRGCAVTAATQATSTPTSLTPAAIAGDPAQLALPAGGFLDVEPAAFGLIAGNNVAAKGDQTIAQVSQTFGVVANIELYRDLQVEQGIFASVAAANAGDTTFDPALAPSITKAQYATLANSSGFHGDGADLAPNLGAGKIVNLQRRVDTSGTQASSNIFFLNNPCAAGFSGALAPATNANNNPTYKVVLNSGTGNVKANITNTPAGQYALGVVSLENDWRFDTAANGYRFVAIDGVHPETGSLQANPEYPANNFYTARLNTINGKYPFVMEMYQYKAKKTTAAFDPLGDEVLQLTVAPGGASLLDKLAKPTNCKDEQRGISILPGFGSTCNDQFSPTPDNVVSSVTKGANNCKALSF